MTSQKQLLLAAASTIILAATLFFIAPQVKNQNFLQQESDLKCVERSTILARGQDWVDKKIPYSQTKTYDGYRTDCSGFVSMCWMLTKPGPSTSQFYAYSKEITKAELLPGDAMNCPGHHICLFEKWTDNSKTHYVSMEQYDTGVGTVKKIQPYPYSNSVDCFKPIRSKTVC